MEQSGWQRLPNSKTIFVAGDQIIGNIGFDYHIDAAIAKIHLPVCSEHTSDNIRRFVDILLLEPGVYLPAWSFNVATSLRSLIKEAGISLQASALFIGSYDTGKSTIAEWLLSLYDSADSPGDPAHFYDAGSNYPALREAVSTYRDIPVVADDRCTSGGSETVRKRGQIIADILRLATSKATQATGRTGSIKQFRAVAGLVITAELGLNSESDWSRFWPIHVRRERVKLPVETRPLAADITYRLIEWAVPRYDLLRESLRIEYQKFLDDNGSQGRRADTTLFVNTWSAYVFCQFCEECCGLDESAANELFGTFQAVLQNCIHFQDEQIHAIQSQRPAHSIPALLVQALDSGELHICSKKKNLYKSAGWEDGNKIYLWPEAVYQWISSQPGYLDASKKSISKELKRYGILIFEYSGASDNTVHLKVGEERHRFLCLNKERLYRAAALESI